MNCSLNLTPLRGNLNPISNDAPRQISALQVDLSLDQELEGRIAVHLGRPPMALSVGASEGGPQLKELGAGALHFGCADASREELVDGVLAGEFAEAESEAAAADAAEEEAEESEDCVPEAAGEEVFANDSPKAAAASPDSSDGDRARSQASVGIAENLGDDCQPEGFPYQAAEADSEEPADSAMEPEDTQRDSSRNLLEQLVETEDANEEDGGEHSQSLCKEHADAIQQAASLRDACEECGSCRDEEDVLSQQPPSMAEVSVERGHAETSELPQPSSPKQLSSELVAFEEEGLQEEVRVPCQDLSLDWSGFRNADMSPGAKSISAAAASEEAEEPADMSLLPDFHAASASPKAGAAASPMDSDGEDAAQSDVEEQADAAMEPEDKQRDSSHDVFEQLVQTVHEECEGSRHERDAVPAQQLPHIADLQSSAQPASEKERPEGSMTRRIVNHMRGFQGTLELHYADSEGESIECDAECSEPVASEQDEPDEDLTLTHSELSSARSDVSLEELADEAESQEPADAEDAATDEEAEDIEEGEAATEGLMDVPEGAAEEVFVNDSPEAATASPFCSDDDALRSQADIAVDLGDDCQALGASPDVEEQADAAMEPEDKQRDSSHDVFEQLVQTVHEECEGSRHERDAVPAQQLPHIADLQSSAQPASEKERPEGSMTRRIVNHMRGFQGTLELHYADSEGESIECDAECSEPVASEQDEPDEDLTLTHSELSSARSDVRLEELADEAESQEPADAEDAATDEEAEDIEEGEAATEGLMDVPEGAAEEVFVNDSPEAAAASPFCSDDDCQPAVFPRQAAESDIEEPTAAMKLENKEPDSSHNLFEQLVETEDASEEDGGEHNQSLGEEHADAIPQAASLRDACKECVSCSDEKEPVQEDVLSQLPQSMAKASAETEHEETSELPQPSSPKQLSSELVAFEDADISEQGLQEEVRVPCQDLSLDWSGFRNADMSPGAKSISVAAASEEGDTQAASASPKVGAAASPMGSDGEDAAQFDFEEPADAAMEPEDKQSDSSHKLFEQLVETEDASEEDGGEHNQSLGEEHADAMEDECGSCRDEEDVLSQQPEASAEREHEETSELPQPSSPKQLRSELVAFEDADIAEQGLQEEVHVPCQDLLLDRSDFGNADLSPGGNSISAAAASEEAEEPADMSLLPDAQAASASPKVGAAASPIMGSDGEDAAQLDFEEPADAAMEPEDKQSDSSHKLFEQLVETEDASEEDGGEHNQSLGEGHADAMEDECGSCRDEEDVLSQQPEASAEREHEETSEPQPSSPNQLSSELVAFEDADIAEQGLQEEVHVPCQDLSLDRSDFGNADLSPGGNSISAAAASEEAEEPAGMSVLPDVQAASESPKVGAAASPMGSDGEDAAQLDFEEPADAAMEPEDKQSDSSHKLFEQLVETEDASEEDGGEHNQSLGEEHADAIPQAATLRDALEDECGSCRDEEDVLSQQPEASAEREHEETSELPQPSSPNQLRSELVAFEDADIAEQGLQEEVHVPCQDLSLDRSDFGNADLSPGGNSISAAAASEEAEEPADMSLLPDFQAASASPKVGAAASPMGSDGEDAAQFDFEEPADAAMEPEDKQSDSSHKLFEQLVETEDASEEDGGEHNQSLGEEHADAIPQAATLRDALEDECGSCRDEEDVLSQQPEASAEREHEETSELPQPSSPNQLRSELVAFEDADIAEQGLQEEVHVPCQDLSLDRSDFGNADLSPGGNSISAAAASGESGEPAGMSVLPDVQAASASPKTGTTSPACEAKDPQTGPDMSQGASQDLEHLAEGGDSKAHGKAKGSAQDGCQCLAIDHCWTCCLIASGCRAKQREKERSERQRIGLQLGESRGHHALSLV